MLKVATRWLCVALLVVMFSPATRVEAQAGWNAIVNVQPFPSPYLSQWEFDPNIVSLVVSGVPGTEPEFRIRLTIRDNGQLVLTGLSEPLRLPGESLMRLVFTPELTNWGIVSYGPAYADRIGQSERLPDGDYELEIRLEGASTGRVLGVASGSFSIASPEPPSLLVPFCSAELDTPYPIFQWTPVQANITNSVHYVLRIVEVIETQIPDQALRSNVPWFEDEDVFTTSIQYPLDARQFEPGKTYAWQVQALDEGGTPPTTNEGRSEICTFAVTQPPIVVPPVSSAATVEVVRVSPGGDWSGTSLAGLENTDFKTILKKIESIAVFGTSETLSLPLPSLISFDKLTLPDAQVSIDSIRGSFFIESTLPILSHQARVMFGSTKSPEGAGGSSAQLFLGLRPEQFKIGDLITPLHGSLLDEIQLDRGLFTLVGSEVLANAGSLSPAALEFFGGRGLDLKPGLSFAKSIPLPGEVSQLARVCELLGISNTDVDLAGSLTLSLDSLIAGRPLAGAVDFHLVARMPIAHPPGFPDWLDSGARTLEFDWDSDLHVSLRDSLVGNLDGARRTFIASTNVASMGDSSTAVIRGEMQDAWEEPYGLTWLDLNDVGIEFSADSEDQAGARLTANFAVGEKTCAATIEVLKSGTEESARFSGSVDKLGLSDVMTLAGKMNLPIPSDLSPEGLFELENATVSFESADATSFAVSANTKVLNVDGAFLLSLTKREGADPDLLLGVRTEDFALSDLASGLGGTPLGGLKIPHAGFTVLRSLSTSGGANGESAESGEESPTGETNPESSGSGLGSISIPWASLSLPARNFFLPVFGGGAGGGSEAPESEAGSSPEGGGGGPAINLPPIRLSPGVNLGGNLPLSGLDPKLLEVLGFTDADPKVRLEGSLGLDIGILGGDSFVGISGWSIRADLPERRRGLLPDWLEVDPKRQRSLEISKNLDLKVSVTDILTAQLDGKERTFLFAADLAAQDTSAAVSLRGEMVGAWKHPYGVEWLDLERVIIELAVADGTANASLLSSFELANKPLDVGIAIEGGKGSRTATLTVHTDVLSTNQFLEFVKGTIDSDIALFDQAPPKNLLDLKDATVTVRVGTERSFSISGLGTVLGQSAKVQFLARKESGQKAQLILGLQPESFSLADALPELDNPIVRSLKLPKAGFVIAKSERRIEAEDLPPDARAFYRELYGTDSFRLDFQPGLSLIGSLPMDGMDADSPLRAVIELLSPGSDITGLVIEGTLPGKVLGLGGDGGISGLSLRAKLPPMAPKNSPEWFVEGIVALEITGRPSVGVVGELTVNVDGDHLTFFIESNIAVVPAGVELGVIGGLKAEEPWVGPLGIDWITFNEVKLKLALNPASVKFGFLGSMAIGQTDIKVAALVPINLYTGVPTGLGVLGESVEGVALSDIAMMQQAMNEAAGRPSPTIPIDALPEMAIKDLGFRFSTMNDPDLELRLGTGVSGQLWIAREPGGKPELFSGILFDISLDGILGKAELANFTVGPIEWKDALLDIALTVPERHMIIHGGLDLGFASGEGSMSMARREMALDAQVKVMNKFACALKARGELNLTSANMAVEGKLESDFNGAMADEIATGVREIFSSDKEFLGPAQEAFATAQALYEERDQAIAAVRAKIAQEREEIGAKRDRAAAAIEPARNAMNAANQDQNAKHNAWKNTPRRQVATRQARFNQYAAAVARFSAMKTAHAAALAAHAAASKAYDALAPGDGNPAVKKALEAANLARKVADKKKAQIEEARAKFKELAGRISQQGSNLIKIEEASFKAQLGVLKSDRSAAMHMKLQFMGKPKALDLNWNFANVKESVKLCARKLMETVRG